MAFLFAGGDVGGVRALLPIAYAAEAAGHKIQALDHRWLRQEGADHWCWLNLQAALHQLQTPCTVTTLLYASSIADPIPTQLATAAKAHGIPIVHVLDNWMNYAKRLQGLDGQPLIPDVYAVMDDLAREEALADGVPAEILHVTGHPNLAKLADEQTQFPVPAATAMHILFISEPVVADYGPRGSNANPRGYDEITLAEDTMRLLGPSLPAGALLEVAPHPREDRAATVARWAALSRKYVPSNVAFRIVPTYGVRAALHRATHVLGMTSILLYEAWLLGKITVSLQPGLSPSAVSSLRQRAGILFCDKDAAMAETLTSCLTQVPSQPKTDLHLHQSAAVQILKLVAALTPV